MSDSTVTVSFPAADLQRALENAIVVMKSSHKSRPVLRSVRVRIKAVEEKRSAVFDTTNSYVLVRQEIALVEDTFGRPDDGVTFALPLEEVEQIARAIKSSKTAQAITLGIDNQHTSYTIDVDVHVLRLDPHALVGAWPNVDSLLDQYEAGDGGDGVFNVDMLTLVSKLRGGGYTKAAGENVWFKPPKEHETKPWKVTIGDVDVLLMPVRRN